MESQGRSERRNTRRHALFDAAHTVGPYAGLEQDERTEHPSPNEPETAPCRVDAMMQVRTIPGSAVKP